MSSLLIVGSWGRHYTRFHNSLYKLTVVSSLWKSKHVHNTGRVHSKADFDNNCHKPRTNMYIPGHTFLNNGCCWDQNANLDKNCDYLLIFLKISFQVLSCRLLCFLGINLRHKGNLDDFFLLKLYKIKICHLRYFQHTKLNAAKFSFHLFWD